MAMKKAFDDSNFTGLSMANPDVDASQKVMWSDLVQGKPDLDDSLTTNAKQMKGEMYMKMFKDSTDLDHTCRLPGVNYLRCLQDNFKDPTQTRTMKCTPAFSSFDVCRKGLLAQQASAVESAMIKQDIADRRAKALFERRAILLDTLTH